MRDGVMNDIDTYSTVGLTMLFWIIVLLTVIPVFYFVFMKCKENYKKLVEGC